MVGGRLRFAVLPMLLVHLPKAALVQVHRIGQHRQHHIVGAKLVVLGVFDRHRQVGNPREAQKMESFDRSLVDTLLRQIGLTHRLVEQPSQADDHVVVQVDDQVGALQVVDPGHVLVADPLDAVSAEAVFQQRRALGRLARRHLAGRKVLLQQVPAANGAGGAGGQGQAVVAVLRTKLLLQHLQHGVAGDLVVPQVVAELIELVEDHQVFTGFAQLPGLVKDLLDVGLAAGGLDHFASDIGQPIEALLAHALRQNGHRFATQQRRIVGAAAAVVAG